MLASLLNSSSTRLLMSSAQAKFRSFFDRFSSSASSSFLFRRVLNCLRPLRMEVENPTLCKLLKRNETKKISECCLADGNVGCSCRFSVFTHISFLNTSRFLGRCDASSELDILVFRTKFPHLLGGATLASDVFIGPKTEPRCRGITKASDA